MSFVNSDGPGNVPVILAGARQARGRMIIGAGKQNFGWPPVCETHEHKRRVWNSITR